MNILIGTVLICGSAWWLWQHLPNHAWRQAALLACKNSLIFVGPRMVLAIFGASYFAELLPREQIQAIFGQNAGLTGIALAVALGPPTPGGPLVAFAVSAAAMKSGASPIAALAYITSWSLFSMTKLLAYEQPLMGRDFLLMRIAISIPIPFIVAGVAGLILPLL